MTFKKATMGYERFMLLCNELGYDSKTVLSIRFTSTKISVVYIDPETDLLQTEDHEVIL